jgi:hypothetical protein
MHAAPTLAPEDDKGKEWRAVHSLITLPVNGNHRSCAHSLGLSVPRESELRMSFFVSYENVSKNAIPSEA